MLKSSDHKTNPSASEDDGKSYYPDTVKMPTKPKASIMLLSNHRGGYLDSLSDFTVLREGELVESAGPFAKCRGTQITINLILHGPSIK